MRQQIQQLIAEGRTEEALTLLAQISSDALLLQARFNNGKKQYNMGLIEFSEWQRTQAQINYAALELSNSIKGEIPPGSVLPASVQPDSRPPATNPSNAGATPPETRKSPASKIKVFISYNSDDIAVARQVRTYLENNNIDVIIDEDDLEAGMSLMGFIEEGIKNSSAVVSIVSEKSLQSGWVGHESVASMYAIWLADKKFIPVRLDKAVFDIDFQIAAQETLLKEIKELKTKIGKLEKLGGDARAFRDDLDRMNELKNNLGKIIQQMKNVRMEDINDPNFETGMRRVLDSINKD
jgi:hypothetical protein